MPSTPSGARAVSGHERTCQRDQQDLCECLLPRAERGRCHSMTDFAVRALDEAEFRPACDVFRRAMHLGPATDEQWRSVASAYTVGRAFGAFVDRTVIGTAMSLPS